LYQNVTMIPMRITVSVMMNHVPSVISPTAPFAKTIDPRDGEMSNPYAFFFPSDFSERNRVAQFSLTP
jgi:hypothetical protein